MTRTPATRNLRRMGTQQAADFVQTLAAAGIIITPEGRKRARARLDRARENFTEQQRAELRQAHTAQ